MQGVVGRGETTAVLRNGEMSRKNSTTEANLKNRDGEKSTSTKQEYGGNVGTSASTTSSRLRKKKNHNQKEPKTPVWGRATIVNWNTLAGCVFVLSVCPILPGIFVLACSKNSGSLHDIANNSSTPSNYLKMMTSTNWDVVGVYSGWLFFQIVLFLIPDSLNLILPSYKGGKQRGAVTPAGNVLSYRINGLQAWIITHLLWFSNAFYFQFFSPSYIAKNIESFFPMANIIGCGLSIFAFVKAHMFPTNPEDCKFSGSVIYDFLMGIEFNPRLGKYFDFKLFCNGRPGIVAWTIINLSFAFYQKEKYGYVTDSMILVNILQAIYVLDFFWNETWYLKTIDIAHDHFGWYLAWGDMVWLPYMYTLQAQYLAANPVTLGPLSSVGILALGIFGYFIFRSANSQKDQFRADPENFTIGGEKASYISASYEASDGRVYKSKLLTSGWWGYARHMNYTGDLLGSLAYCLCCGSDHVLPYFYIIYMFILLTHRIYRDEHRCQNKYGEYWKQYCTTVPYRLIPKIF